MAVSRTTAWVDSTGIVDYVGAARVKTVRVTLGPSATGTAYLQLYDGATFTPGSDLPTAVLPLLAPSANKTQSFPFPGGGLRFSTGVCSFVATTHDGGTAATTNVPLAVDVHYAPGN